MKSNIKRAFVVFVVLFLTATLVLPVFAAPPQPGSPAGSAQALATIDWKVRHDITFYETTLKDLAKTYPKIVKVYSIGHSWYERQLWTAEITSDTSKPKTGIYIVANIHGGEQEGAESAMYFAWWLATNSADKAVKDILDNYIVYVTPVMNPDGYVASMVYNTRQNLRPTDANGDGKNFGDPYTDTNGDGFISDIYTGAQDSKVEDRKKVGMESPDWDKNGKPGDDPKNSAIDLNRTFDYMWNRRDVDATPFTGGDAFLRAGPDAASEPEVQAVQNFLIAHPVHAVLTLHTGEQSVLYPWCYTGERAADYTFMKKVAAEMVVAYETTTGRPAYEKQSYDDYPTAAEMIDWTYGRLGIHSYTMEVYVGGLASTEAGADDSETHTWGNELPATKWEYIGDWQGLKDVWFMTSSRAQMAGIAPPDQDKLVAGVKDATLKMIASEPVGPGAVVPEFLKWEK